MLKCFGSYEYIYIYIYISSNIYIYIYIYIYIHVCVCVCVCKGGNHQFSRDQLPQLVGLILWHINSCRIFNAKSYLYIHIPNICDL